MSSKTMTERDGYIATFDREYQTTLKLLRAFPADKGTLKPSERSQSARDLGWTLVMSQMVVEAIQGNELKPGGLPPAPDSWNEVLTSFEAAHAKAMSTLGAMTEAHFNDNMRLPVGPGKIADVRRADALWMMLYDTIHHRGQMSVYVRIAGGKVMSIYGPSGDEPWW